MPCFHSGFTIFQYIRNKKRPKQAIYKNDGEISTKLRKEELKIIYVHKAQGKVQAYLMCRHFTINFPRFNKDGIYIKLNSIKQHQIEFS